MSYHPNPKRGCGKKTNDACYAEGGEFSLDGMLLPWVWLLGDGVRDNIYMKIPPRQVVLVNPIATLTLRDLIGDGWPFEIPQEQESLFENLTKGIKKSRGLADHVGTRYYTPYSFARECEEHGPSRRVSKDMAKELAEIIFQEGPIPMLFTHGLMPVFRHEEDRVHALTLVEECYQADLNWKAFDYVLPTWMDERWGMYGGCWGGGAHYLVPVLTTLSLMQSKWSEIKDVEAWQRFRKFFENSKHVRFVEQPFGMSWLCQISYTLDEDGKADPEMLDVPGLNIIDLDAVEEEQDEQTESAPLGAD
jgi:hypothetical protein